MFTKQNCIKLRGVQGCFYMLARSVQKREIQIFLLAIESPLTYG